MDNMICKTANTKMVRFEASCYSHALTVDTILALVLYSIFLQCKFAHICDCFTKVLLHKNL